MNATVSVMESEGRNTAAKKEASAQGRQDGCVPVSFTVLCQAWLLFHYFIRVKLLNIGINALLKTSCKLNTILSPI